MQVKSLVFQITRLQLKPHQTRRLSSPKRLRLCLQMLANARSRLNAPRPKRLVPGIGRLDIIGIRQLSTYGWSRGNPAQLFQSPVHGLAPASACQWLVPGSRRLDNIDNSTPVAEAWAVPSTSPNHLLLGWRLWLPAATSNEPFKPVGIHNTTSAPTIPPTDWLFMSIAQS